MTSTVDKPSASNGTEEEGFNLSHRQIVVILIGLMTGMFLAALDQTIVGTAIRTIADDLNGLSLQAWITTAYLITATIATPIYGKLSDIYGRKPFYLAAITIFLVGSIGCSFAQSMYQLAAFRAVQGLGAGGLMSLALTILGDIVPPRRRAKYQGFFLAVFGTSTVLGPVLGGFFAGLDSFLSVEGWRWVFLVNAPLGIIALFVVAKVLNVPHQRHDHRIDWWGGLALVVCLVPLLLIAEQGREWGWGSQAALLCYGIGGVGLVMFLLIERKMKDEALIPLRLFRNSTFSVAIAGGVIVGVAMFGSIMLIPQYLQIVQGYTPTEAGLLSLPLMVGVMSGSVLSGQLTSRTGRYKVFPVVGTALMTIGMLLFAQVRWDSPIWQPLVFMAVIGLGLGGCMQTLIIAVQNAGPRRDMGVSTASATFFRQIGGTLGVAVFLSILFSTLTGKITAAFQAEGVDPAAMNAAGGDIMQDSSFLNALPIEQAKPFLIGFTDSINLVFYIGAGVAALAFLVLLFMKEIPLADGAPKASPMEGGEALVDDGDDGDDAAEKTAETDEADRVAREAALLDADEALTEPALVTAGRHSLPQHNGNGQLKATASGAPIVAGLGDADEVVETTRVPGQSITGHVRRQDGSAVAAAALTLIDQKGRQVGRSTGLADGGYLVETPGSGTYVLIVSAGGYQPQASSVVVNDNGATTRLDITLTGSGEVTGFVRSSTEGTPLPGVTVTLADSRGEVTGAAITQDDGRYSFTGVGAGSYTLVASGEGFRPCAVTLTVPDSGVLSHDVELTGAALLSGTARTEGDRVVGDARVTVLDAEGNVAAVARTDDSGRYVVSDLPAGNYTVVASGYPPAASEVRLDGGEAEHDVRLGYDKAIDDLTGPQY
ncbi:MFS transporter [Prauserella marina]|uniref:Drug resistance transporter, EmrB/QacA subfamily n=1 Tax=Prauserella marina TaxID=530584 RepID=A0A222VY81_9PSEU|nr:MFS transporter [Prauserella marina]ASR38661.1 MFS transporter [Prauserella marina]PWV81994.1 EmrB/QacA subfamily drug resistance transporter [Prauserella marina]SDD16975.1 drug resistance transporter, EmrB/QacA subfamily [Prauserella marina]